VSSDVKTFIGKFNKPPIAPTGQNSIQNRRMTAKEMFDKMHEKKTTTKADTPEDRFTPADFKIEKIEDSMEIIPQNHQMNLDYPSEPGWQEVVHKPVFLEQSQEVFGNNAILDINKGNE